ncbi:hypothetical protein V8E54_014174 [Elaphomyces granulatus]
MSRVIICVSKSEVISLQKFLHLHCCNFAPPWTTIPDLRILGDIPLYIEFYNETNEEPTKGCLAICFSFKDKSPGQVDFYDVDGHISACLLTHIPMLAPLLLLVIPETDLDPSPPTTTSKAARSRGGKGSAKA